MKRADRKGALGKSIDTICGYVSGKTASGGVTGDTPFLYLVQEDKAYIGGFMATTIQESSPRLVRQVAVGQIGFFGLGLG